MSPVNISKWDAAIVPVSEKNSTVRICVGYKLTINKGLVLDAYQLPIPEDLISTLVRELSSLNY